MMDGRNAPVSDRVLVVLVISGAMCAHPGTTNLPPWNDKRCIVCIAARNTSPEGERFAHKGVYARLLSAGMTEAADPNATRPAVCAAGLAFRLA